MLAPCPSLFFVRLSFSVSPSLPPSLSRSRNNSYVPPLCATRIRERVQSASMRVPADLPAPSTERLRLMLDVRLGLLTIAEQLRQSWSAHAAAAGLSTAQVN